MAYDTMGNYVGDYTMGNDYETDEQRRRRLAEEAAQAPVTQKITYNPDGTQKMTISGTPEALSSAQPNTPTVTAPVNPAYNQYIAQNESGGNANIGYHNQAKSSAYGPYGITAGAYQDARRANPALPADITQTNPAQMTQAQDAVTANNARYLQAYGVEPTQNNLAAAHFLGARGLSDYLKTGAISPAAAAANGGEANVRRIVDQRLGMNASPASGAVPQTRPAINQETGENYQQMMPAAAPAAPVSPYSLATGTGAPGLQMPQQAAPVMTGPNLEQSIQRYQTAQENPMELLKLANDDSVSQGIRDRARSRATDMFIQEKDRKEAEQRLAQMAVSGTPKDARDLTKSGDKGNWLRYLFLGYVNPAAAEQEGIKLGIAPTKFETRRLDGQAVQLETRRDGRVVGGLRMDGTALTADEVARAAASMVGKNVSTAAEYLTDKSGNIYRSQANEFGDLETKDIATGKTFAGRSSDLTRLRDTANLENARQKARIDLDKQFQTMDRRARIKAFEDTNAMLVNRGEAPLSPAEMGLDLTTGAIRGEPAAATTPAATTPAAPAATTPAAPGSTPPAAAAANVPAAAARRPGETVSEKKKREAEEESQRKVTEAGRKEVITEAAKQVAASPDTQNLINSINKVTGLIDSGEHNIGSNLSVFAGRGPIAQAIGNQFETPQAKNTKIIMDTVQKLAADGLKVLGTNPSVVDLQFWTRFKPDANSDPDFVKEWIESRSEDLKRRIGYAQTQVGAGGAAPAAGPVNSAPRGSAANPIKLN